MKRTSSKEIKTSTLSLYLESRNAGSERGTRIRHPPKQLKSLVSYCLQVIDTTSNLSSLPRHLIDLILQSTVLSTLSYNQLVSLLSFDSTSALVLDNLSLPSAFYADLSSNQWTACTKLSLNHIQLNQSRMIKVLKSMPLLTYIAVRGNLELKNEFADQLLKSCPRIVYVNVSLTGINQIGISKILELDNVQTIKMEKMSEKVAWKQVVSNAATLKSLRLRANPGLGNLDLLRLIGSSTLSKLDVSFNAVSVIPCSNLTKLNIYGTRIKQLDALLLNLLPSLSSLIMGNCGLNDDFFSRIEWFHFISLTRLSLSDNPRISSIEGLLHVASLPECKIKRLDLSGCGVGDFNYSFIRGNKSVCELNLSGNRVGDELSSWIGRFFSEMKYLDLSSTRTSVEGVDIILSSTDLEWVSFDGCRSINWRERNDLVINRLAALKKRRLR